MSKKLILILFVGLGLAVGIYHILFPQTLDPRQTGSSGSKTTLQVDKPTQNPVLQSESFTWRFKKQAQLVAQIDSDPQKTLEELKEFSRSLGEEDLNYLAQMALDPKQNGDERALAVYLLNLSPLDLALAQLQAIALDPIEGSQEGPFFEQELLIRALTIDGFSQNPNHETAVSGLRVIESQAVYSFIVDRSRRALHYLEGGGDSPQVQEVEALKKLMGRKGAQ